MLIHGPDISFVTGHTIHRDAVTGIRRCFTHWMGKLLMLGMTAGTDLLRRGFDHPRPVGTVQVVTIGAFIPVGMLVQHLGSPTESPLVAEPTTGPLIGRQQTGPITDMGVMAGIAGIAAVDTLQMAVGMVERFQHIAMAPEADVDPLRSAMTGATITFGKGRMGNFPQHGPVFPAVRMMTAQAIKRLRVPSEVGFFHCRFGFMAPQAQTAAGSFKLAIVVTAVGVVTDAALSVPVRFMGIGIRFFGLFVAPETKVGFPFAQQAGKS